MPTLRLVAAFAGLAAPTAACGIARTAAAEPSAWTTAAPVRQLPRIRFAAPVFDFGNVAAGTSVTHRYEVRNVGDAPLTITGVEPMCGCTTAGKWSATVEPGRTGFIPIRFNSSGYGGAITKWVLVTSNDPERPRIVLTLEGRVRTPIDVSPANVVFMSDGDARSGETKIIHIINHARDPLILASVDSTNRAFSVKLKTVSPGRAFDLRVRIAPHRRPGTIRGLIMLRTNSAQEPLIAITALAMTRRSASGGSGRGSGDTAPAATAARK